MASHHLIASYSFQHRMHDRPFLSSQCPSFLSLLFWKAYDFAQAQIAFELRFLDENPAPYNITGLTNTLESPPSVESTLEVGVHRPHHDNHL
jgi:hypothetical protein